MNINTTPPNNLDQLIAWTRVFVSQINENFQAIDKEIKTLSKSIKRMENEQYK